MKKKESGSQIDNPKEMEVNIDVKVKVNIIHLRMSPETFGTPEIDYGVLSSLIYCIFVLLAPKIANFE